MTPEHLELDDELRTDLRDLLRHLTPRALAYLGDQVDRNPPGAERWFRDELRDEQARREPDRLVCEVCGKLQPAASWADGWCGECEATRTPEQIAGGWRPNLEPGEPTP